MTSHDDVMRKLDRLAAKSVGASQAVIVVMVGIAALFIALHLARG
jgi:hypothetical protein